MNRYFRNYLAVSLLLTMSAPSYAREPSGGPEGTDVKIKVYVYNYAQLSSTVLAQARQAVKRIYRAAGVEAAWADCPLAADDAHQYPDCQPAASQRDWVALRLLSRSMIGGLQLSPATFGLAALPEDGGFGNVAVVCSQCAEQMLEGRRYLFGAVLGGLMAHEMGHLLLSNIRHSAVGVMHSPWNQVDLEHAAQGRLLFTAKEARRIRAQVRERVRHTSQMAQLRESR